jgi:hypothetical protein|tara:strand:- start:6396 stop:7304 length:909 start_codon:yes stop_codon:yes gene_type:complete
MNDEKQSTIVQALKDATGDLLTEDTLKSLEESFEAAVADKVTERVSLQVEKALVEQDEDHASKLEALLEAIDGDHTAKLSKVLKAVNENHAHKLKQVVGKYSKDVVEEASEFKSSLVDKISSYLDLYIENAIPLEDFKEAVKNRKAYDQLQEMRKVLAVNFAMSKDSIKSAIQDGKRQIDESSANSAKLLQEKSKLEEDLTVLKRSKLLEEKTAGLPVVKRRYISRVLGNKPIEFIEENYDYTLKMFERTEEDKLEDVKKQAQKKSIKVDRPVITEATKLASNAGSSESVDPMGYMTELNKF